jgi:hypothetical protein
MSRTIDRLIAAASASDDRDVRLVYVAHARTLIGVAEAKFRRQRETIDALERELARAAVGAARATG